MDCKRALQRTPLCDSQACIISLPDLDWSDPQAPEDVARLRPIFRFSAHNDYPGRLRLAATIATRHCLFVVVVQHIATPGEHEHGRCHHHRCTPVYSAEQKRCEDSEPRPGCSSPAPLPPNLQKAFGRLSRIGEKALQPGQRAMACQYEFRFSRR